jgi:non-ribosomal peptide synthetase component F
VVLRTEVGGTETVRELLARVRDVTLDAYAHEAMPFDRLVELLRPPRLVNRPPLFQVEIEYHRLADTPPAPPGLTVSPRETHSPTTTLDLSLHVVQTETVIRGGLVYNADVFDATSAGRMVGEFRLLLAGMTASPNARVDDVAARAEDEWRARERRQRAETARARFERVHAKPVPIDLGHGGT